MTNNKVDNLKPGDVVITDPFFKPVLERTQAITIPDILGKFESEGSLGNFDAVAEGRKAAHVGPPWYDGLIYECITGISDSISNRCNELIDARMQRYADKIINASLADADGYLNTWTQLTHPEWRWGENGGLLVYQHEIYNAGALVEAAVHRFMANGKVDLLKTAVKFADYLCDLIGPSPKKNYVPAHSLPEEAFVHLYDLLVAKPDLLDILGIDTAGKYLDLACFWLENRGNHSGEPDWDHLSREECERKIRNREYAGDRPSWGKYAQDHMPLLDQDEAVGHAVRATLLYTGLATAAAENGNERYLHAASSLWEDIIKYKTYISGGIGSDQDEEKFGSRFHLPQDGHLETCAAVGAAFFHNAMFLARPEGKYVDELERALYNGILVGISLDGTRYFYRNPLISDGRHHRWEWHDCPCCPPMLLKVFGRLPGWIYAMDQFTLYVNLYVGSETSINMAGTIVGIRQESKIPWAGTSTLRFALETRCSFSVKCRIPYWSTSFEIFINGEKQVAGIIDGYARLQREWVNNDLVEIHFGMPVLLVSANQHVECCLNQQAIQRGPLLYCVEECDNPSMESMSLPDNPIFRVNHQTDLLGGVAMIESGSPDIQIHAIPYFAWDNREPGRMKVWIDSGNLDSRQFDSLYSYRECLTLID